MSESDTHFQKLSLSPVCSVKNRFFTHRYAVSNPQLFLQNVKTQDNLIWYFIRTCDRILSVIGMCLRKQGVRGRCSTKGEVHR